MRRLAAAATPLVVLALAGCTGTAVAPSQPSAAARTTRTHRTSTAHPGSPAPTATQRPGGSLPTCALDSLPSQARDTARLVVKGGPFPYRRNDGVTYYNRNGVLPKRPTGVYREFTVPTPGAPTRGTRRIITDGNPAGGAPTTSPSAWYYTGDHYTTFCALTGTP